MAVELRVIHGDASPEEIAAVVAVLAASGGEAVEPEPEAPSLWGAPQLRQPLPPPGPGAWVASGWRL